MYWHNRANVYAQMGQHAKAVADFSKAIDLKPDDGKYWNGRGVVHGRLGLKDKALADHIKASELNPKAPGIWCNRGSAFAELGQWEKAAAAFEHATALKPDLPFAWYCLAMSQLRRGDRAGHRKVCFRMLEHFDQSANADAAFWTTWACVLAPDTVGDWTKLLKLADKAYADRAKDCDRINNLGAVLYRAGRVKEAAQRLTEAAVAFKPTATPRTSTVYNWFFQAMAQHRLGHTAEAANWLKKAVQEIDRPSPKTAQDPATNTWNRRLTLELLRREAEELLAKER
jgi:tetratricopeptide (TPR) repeat protein